MGEIAAAPKGTPAGLTMINTALARTTWRMSEPPFQTLLFLD
jgi:hypothetical protein